MATTVFEDYRKMWEVADELAEKEVKGYKEVPGVVTETTTTSKSGEIKVVKVIKPAVTLEMFKADQRLKHLLGMMELMMAGKEERI